MPIDKSELHNSIKGNLRDAGIVLSKDYDATIPPTPWYKSMMKVVDEYARQRGQSRCAIVREALYDWMKAKGLI